MMSGPSGFGLASSDPGPLVGDFEESRMDMIKTLRRFPMAFAPLALLLSPLGCGSDSPSTPVAEVPPPVPAAVDGAVATEPAPASPTAAQPAPMPPSAAVEMPGNLDQAAKSVDRDVRRAADDVKDEIRDAKGDVKKAVDHAKGEADREAKELRNDARQAAEKALDNLLGQPK
jgi:hypothetical protein